MDLIMFGMQGAGKGTVGKRIAKDLNLKVFGTGEALRTLATKNSELGRKVKSIIEVGHLVPNEIVMNIVKVFISKLPAGTNILFDGIPRKMEQAISLNTLLEKLGRPYKALLIDITKETAMRRLTTRKICSSCKEVYTASYKENTCAKCGAPLIIRADDNPEIIKVRLEAFDKETMPAIKIYKNNLIKVDGEGTIEEVALLAEKILKKQGIF